MSVNWNIVRYSVLLCDVSLTLLASEIVKGNRVKV